MKDRNTTLSVPVIIAGNGTSLWQDGSPEGCSKGKFVVTSYCMEHPYELCLYGPKTVNRHYTDEAIEKNVNKKFKALVKKHYPKIDLRKTRIIWSEWGMQPVNGWSFDIIN